MRKEYKTLISLIKTSEVKEILEYKFLELRDRFPIFNNICSYGFNHDSTSIVYDKKSNVIKQISDCSVYQESIIFDTNYIAYWVNTKLVRFNPNPKPGDGVSLKLEDIFRN